MARGIAMVGMLAVHVFYTFNSDGSPSIATELAAGRSAAIFAVMAGVGLALVTGGRHPVKGAARVAASTGLVVRALLICLIGLMLGYAATAAGLDVYVILPYYAAMFLLAIPLLGLRPRMLAGIAHGAGRLGQHPEYARHGRSIGGESPLEGEVVLTPSRRQLRRREAGWEGSPRRIPAPRNTNRV